MVLLETIAHAKLRRFERSEAEVFFTKSLAISEDIGVTAERSLILSNLGIIYNQQARLREAVAVYRRAADIARRRCDDYVLAGIESNLAMLHAKMGSPELAEGALRRAVDHEARSGAQRVRFLRLFARGMVESIGGRYEDAVDSFREAVELGIELGDRLLTTYSLGYLGECETMRGELSAARAALERARSAAPEESLPTVREFLSVREAFASATSGDRADARELFRDLPASDPPGDYASAWNRVLLARAMGGEAPAESLRVLRSVRVYFRRVGVPSGQCAATLEMARIELERGQVERARRRLDRLQARERFGGRSRLGPALSARYFVLRASVSMAARPPDLASSRSAVLEAELCLLGRRLHDVEKLLRDARRRWRVLADASPAGTRTLMPPRVLAERSTWAREIDAAAEALAARLDRDVGESPTPVLRSHVREFRREIDEIRRAFGAPADERNWDQAFSTLAESPAMGALLSQVEHFARTELPVLIRGETGTGKELVARSIHGKSGRAGSFVSIDCGSLPEELLEVELFGCVAGAYSDATEDREGLLAAAMRGTVFFDEITDAPMGLQAKLLRVLDRGRVRPVGATEERPLDVRYIFSSRSDLDALVESGELRKDLFYRVRSCELAIPPLRDHLEDLPALVERFRDDVTTAPGEPRFSPEAMRELAEYSWPGNVRELQNVVTRLCLTTEREVSVADVQRAIGRGGGSSFFSSAFLRSRPLPELLRSLETEYFRCLGSDLGGDVRAMALRIGVSRQALYKRLKSLGLDVRTLGATREG